VSLVVKSVGNRFQGASNLALDAKGRLSVPARHREVLQLLCGGPADRHQASRRLPDGVSAPTWEVPRQGRRAADVGRRLEAGLPGNAMDVEIDSAARVLISPELRRRRPGAT
jgi:MraZ protein